MKIRRKQLHFFFSLSTLSLSAVGSPLNLKKWNEKWIFLLNHVRTKPSFWDKQKSRWFKQQFVFQRFHVGCLKHHKSQVGLSQEKTLQHAGNSHSSSLFGSEELNYKDNTTSSTVQHQGSDQNKTPNTVRLKVQGVVLRWFFIFGLGLTVPFQTSFLNGS